MKGGKTEYEGIDEKIVLCYWEFVRILPTFKFLNEIVGKSSADYKAGHDIVEGKKYSKRVREEKITKPKRM